MPTIAVGGIEYFYRDEGDGPAVILGHSDASSSGQWRALMEDLRGEFRLLAYDISSQGRSALWPAQRPHSLTDEVAPVLALAGLAEGPLHLVGHSVGGYILLNAALMLGERVASLTLAEPVVFALLRQQGLQEPWNEISTVARTFQGHVRDGRPAQAMEGFIDYWTQPGGWFAIPEERRALLLDFAPKLALEWDMSFTDTTPLSAFAALRLPTLLLRGERTTPAARAVFELLAGAWPHAQVEVVPGAGHMAPVTHPDPVNAHIAAHLRQQRG